MKKSKKKLAAAALLAGSVVLSATSCHRNPTVYGPPEELRTGDENGAAGETKEEFSPDDNMNEDVYGPPADMQ